MPHKRMTVQEAVEYIQGDDSFNDFSFRGDDFTPVKHFRKSKYHGDEAQEFQLPGVSAVNVFGSNSKSIEHAICKAREYGKNVFLLAGRARNAHEWACDPEEVLMESHQIIAVIDADFEKSGIYSYGIVNG